MSETPETLAELETEILAAYPGLRVSRELLRDLFERDAGEVARSELRMADFYLARACAASDASALRAFDSAFGSDIEIAIRKSPTLGVSNDEFRQIFRDRMFVRGAGDEQPRIASYGGRGSLKSWVRVAAARLVVDLSRKPAQPQPRADEELARLLPVGADPEIEYLRQAYAGKLPEAFRRALAQLTARQRNLLRQRYLYGLDGPELAASYGVHRATIFAWLDDARKKLLVHLHEALRQTVPDHALDSVLELLGSQLDISVRGALDSQLEDDSPPGA